MAINFRKSYDDGVSWETAVEVVADACISSCLTEDENGTLYALYVKSGNTAHLKISNDEGKTWGAEIDIETTDGVSLVSSAYAFSGVIFVIALMSDASERLYSSKDSGKTWSYRAVT